MHPFIQDNLFLSTFAGPWKLNKMKCQTSNWHSLIDDTLSFCCKTRKYYQHVKKEHWHDTFKLSNTLLTSNDKVLIETKHLASRLVLCCHEKKCRGTKYDARYKKFKLPSHGRCSVISVLTSHDRWPAADRQVQAEDGHRELVKCSQEMSWAKMRSIIIGVTLFSY